jgi:hypothetical protein
VLLVAAIAVGAAVISSRPQSVAPGAGGSGDQSSPPSPPPTLCPLTGDRPEEGDVPVRPALAVKVENLPASRPQTGMSWADVVYEEPVEGGITRFIAVYQCEDAGRIEPVRSARMSDVDILLQFGRPLFAYSGAVPEVMRAVRAAGITDLNATRAPGVYHKDPARQAPHDVYTSTEELYGLAPDANEIPDPIFTYADRRLEGPRVPSVHIPFSSASDVYWRWDREDRQWIRSHGTVPHTYSDGTQVGTRNLVVQVVKVRLTDVVDAAGVPSPRVVSVGTGKAYILRGGRVVEGRWIRDSVEDVTRYVDENGEEIPLSPGKTWVELVPNDIPVSLE